MNYLGGDSEGRPHVRESGRERLTLPRIRSIARTGFAMASGAVGFVDALSRFVQDFLAGKQLCFGKGIGRFQAGGVRRDGVQLTDAQFVALQFTPGRHRGSAHAVRDRSRNDCIRHLKCGQVEGRWTKCAAARSLSVAAHSMTPGAIRHEDLASFFSRRTNGDREIYRFVSLVKYRGTSEAL